ncbi:MAG: sigma-70 family RNA polymerase sigma factor [Pseudonocardiales bacterium]|nr:sigma-70 family RNA polymerase sigma factor [Pseudonocardiales bacterium]
MTTTTIDYSSAEATESLPDLLRGISSGDSSAWEEILRRYGRLVSTTVRSFRLQEADALDAIQTTWLRLAENAHRVQHPERLAGWLATTARRECLRCLRHAKTGPNFTDWALDAVSDPSAGPEQRAIEANVARMLGDLVDELPPLRRNLIRMLFTDNPLSYAEIAHIVGIPLGGIGPTRARALRQLRDKIDEHDLGPVHDAAPTPPPSATTSRELHNTDIFPARNVAGVEFTSLTA